MGAMMQDDLDTMLDAVLATLLPGDGPWPEAGSLALGGAARAELGTTWDRLRGALPEDFAMRDASAREAVLRGLEAAASVDFERLIVVAYTAYYTDARVRAVLARETGYEDRPPQPLGYALEPFDERLLETQLRRAPFWREA